ncbi:uncharacterized protein LOC110447021 [Mizuhopecten yessoensis]|uniref:Uncharacterized protein n=1 Tax=Mizuhopecten yessoensis TaxID=6573 RepID=A0A210QW93_MIZYE|nr:uncharacterized protein LOC110447021 [Mizuhopecten yessoensis]OWF52974.1 hypothetical protein KP79_PYT10825 [Mizuhopecten yessoensis]
MGIVDGVKSASLFGKLAFFMLAVALLFVYIAFATTGWGENDTGKHWGLWRICGNNVYSPGCTQVDGWAVDWYAAVQALAIFGFVGINVAFLLVCLLLFTSQCGGNKEVSMGAAIVCIVTGALLLIGCIVFGAEFDDLFIDKNLVKHKLSYSFGLAIVASLLEIVSGVLLLLEGLGKGTSPSG